MSLTKNIRITGALTLLGIFGLAGSISARENVVSSGHKTQPKTTAVTGCQPAVAAIDLDINNVRARLMTGGDMWWNIGLEVAAYEVPKNSGKSSQFAASCWIGGVDKQGQLKVAAQTYRQDGNDYWPGALDHNGKISADVCANWDMFWKVDKSTINSFIELSKSGGNIQTSQFSAINNWPATGNYNAKGANGTSLNLTSSTYSGNSYAPFVDKNGNGVYEPNLGDYPDINGDQFIWWVFNDAGNVKLQSQTASMGIEVQTSAFAYSTQDFLNNATFYNYRVINRGALTIDSTYIAVWDDCDLGYYHDDYIGCDTARGLGIQYNGVNADGQESNFPVNSYGLNPPQVGVDFFKGPIRTVHRQGMSDTIEQLGMTNFTYYNNDFSIIGNPSNGVQIYNYMTGTIRDGESFSDDFQGPGINSVGYGKGPISHFVFTGDPGDKTTWSECTCNNNKGDRRFIFSSGPFELVPGAVNDITFGCIWASGVGGCPNTDFKTIKNIDDGAQALFDDHFKTVEGPEAPRLVVRELDRKLVFYMVNDYGSNNYAENYGRSDGTYKDSLQYHQIVTKAKEISNDTLYHFEGYRVFQLANSSVTTAEIFDPTTGEVDNTKAYEVFQCDLHNNVTKIINYSKVTSVSDTTWTPQIKVNGKDSGISHSFFIDQDQFATTADKQLINYHNYYFVAIAYAYNNFAQFNPLPNVVNSTQDAPYLGSAHGAGGVNIPVVTGIPNPANGDMGTTLTSTYGDGVIVTRVEGQGNGGNSVELSDATVTSILGSASGTAGNITYNKGQAPVTIKIIDPEKVQACDWVFQITGNVVNGILDSSAGWKLTALSGGAVKDVIYSERDLHTVNEQIIEKYGLSVSAVQAKAPGVQQDNGNGYITSSIEFEDPSQSWLWGVTDQSDSNAANWLRTGNNQTVGKAPYSVTNPCNYLDYMKLDTFQQYQFMLANFTPAKSSWGPYNLAAAFFGKHYSNGSACPFEVAYSGATQNQAHFATLPDVNIVFTSDRKLWTRCAVVEEQEDSALAENGASKFYLRRHAGWGMDMPIGADGKPVYSSDASENGMSWFPGYAIDEGTGRRLNIVFGEDSYLGSDNGNDMLFNPSTNLFNAFDGSALFGGKHFVYVLGTTYDEDSAFVAMVKQASPNNTVLQTAYSYAQWIGLPRLNPALSLLPLSQGLIPTTTTLRFRVDRPYAPYAAADTTDLAYATAGQATLPYYTFSTKTQAPVALSDTTNRSRLLSRIFAVPNPYYGYSGYETNRYDTKVKIINLPQRATVHIYALDGTLVRTLSKDDATSYLDWDVRNAAGLPIASGMYLIHVNAEGIGETVVKWFGAMRPIDATSY